VRTRIGVCDRQVTLMPKPSTRGDFALPIVSVKMQYGSWLKKLQVSEVQAEQFRETEAFLRLVREDFARQGVGNLEAIELGLRRAMLQDGRCLLEQLLVETGASLADNTSRPGEKCHPERTKSVQTIFGEIELRRCYFYQATSHTERAPLDEALGLSNGFSPGLVRLSARAAAREGHGAASQDLLALAGIKIEGRQIQRLVNFAWPDIATQLALGQSTDTGRVPVMYIEDGTQGCRWSPTNWPGAKASNRTERPRRGR
jgi:hypothetical protein